MVATVINFNFKAMPAFGWDPERGGGGNERASGIEVGLEGKSGASRLHQSRCGRGGRAGKFKRRSGRCRGDSASFCGKKGGWQHHRPSRLPAQGLSVPSTHSHGTESPGCQTPSHGPLLSPTLKSPCKYRQDLQLPPQPSPSLSTHGACSLGRAAAKLQKSHPSPPCHPESPRSLLPSCRDAVNAVVFASHALGAAEQPIPLPLLHPI